MKIIQDNPFRQLGVYSNSPKKERMANLSRMRAYLKVGKRPASDLDFEGLLPPIERSEESVANAEASLTLPKDQMHYAQFWFINSTPLDIVAFNHLKGGGAAEAKVIWQKRNCASSLQNRIVLALIQKNWAEALSCCEALYGDKDLTESLFYSVTGEEGLADADDMALHFIDTLADEVGADNIIRHISNTKWRHHLGGKASKQVSDAISRLISSAEDANGAYAALRAANRLRNEAGVQLSELKSLLGKEDPDYRMMADKIADSIIRCCIEYFNKTDDYGSIRQLKSLMEYALSIAEGQFEKNRCQENLAILQGKIDELPPEEIAEDAAAVSIMILTLNLLEGKTTGLNLLSQTAETLVEIKSHLQKIEKKVGKENKYYLALSTDAVCHIEKNIGKAVCGIRDNSLKTRELLSVAWKLYTTIDTFAMKESYRREMFIGNKSALKAVCETFGVTINSNSAQTIPNRQTAQRPATKGYVSREEASDRDETPMWVYTFIIAIVSLVVAFTYHKINH